MAQPQVIALFCIIFVALGIFNVIMGRRRKQQTSVPGIQLPWYKQTGILVGIEYMLIGVAFLMNISISYHWLPASLNSIIFPFYLVVLLASGVLAGVVIYRSVTNARLRRSQSTQTAQPQEVAKTNAVHYRTEEERALHAQRLRERRQKAAAARRRRAGKA